MVASISALISSAQASSYYEADDYYADGGLSLLANGRAKARTSWAFRARLGANSSALCWTANCLMASSWAQSETGSLSTGPVGM